MTTLFTLLVLFQLKHFIADYLLQNDYMLGKFKTSGWIAPLAAHCGVHFITTLVILLVTSPASNQMCLLMAGLDFAIHFAMDRIKASPNMLGKYQQLTKTQYVNLKMDLGDIEERIEEYSSINFDKSALDFVIEHKSKIKSKFDSNKKFWWSVGFDQMVHHLTHYLIIYLVIYV